MKTVNRVQLLGLVGNSPKIYAMANGTLVARFSIATENVYKDKSKNTIKKSTEWHSIVMLGNLAEITEQFLQKGTRIYVDGRLKTRKYENDEKHLCQVTEIIAEDLIILSNGKDQPATTIFNFQKIPPNLLSEGKHEA
jgi:single-strand DNA-binding protein